MNILLVFATEKEAALIKSMLQPGRVEDEYAVGGHKIRFNVTGVGGASTSWSLMKWFSENGRPDLAINAGIAGSFVRDLLPGEVVMPVTDCFADSGIEIDGHFQTLFEYGLAGGNESPYENGVLVAGNAFVEKLGVRFRKVKAVTVNMASGSHESIDKYTTKYNPEIETMEGATFFYICAREKVPFLALRAISNYVEPGKRGKWEIPLALDHLAEKVFETLQIL